jgi:hypothetical protein
MSKPKKRTYYVATQDNFAACAVPYAPTRPTRLIGVAAPGLFSCLSFLQDQRPVSQVVGINNCEAHLNHFREGMRCWREAAQKGDPRQKMFAEWLGWVLPDDPANAEPVWLDKDHRVFLRPDMNEIFLRGDHGEVGRRFAVDWLGRMPRGRNGSCLGWDYGWLDEAMFYRPPPPVVEEDWVIDDINYELERQLSTRTDEDVVVYLSNLLVGASNVPQLRDLVLELSGAHGVHFWVDADTVRNPHHQKQYFGDSVPFELDPATRLSPHGATNQALAELRTDGTLLELHPHGTLTKRTHFRSYFTNGSEAFIAEPKHYDTIALHIMSCFHHGDYVINDKHIRNVIDYARVQCDRLLIMDHNPHTRDHLHNRLHNSGTPIQYYRYIMGRVEDDICWCRGITDMRRNYVLSYDQPGT